MFLVKERLPLSDHPQYMIVDNDLNHRKMVARSGGQLIHVHAKAAVATDIDARDIRISRLSTDTGAQSIAHGTKTSGSQKGSGLVKGEILCRPDLMLTDIRRQDGVSLC